MAFTVNTPQIGVVGIDDTDLYAPGLMNVRDNTGSGRWPQLGAICSAWDPVYGGGEFIYLAVPTSTSIASGLLVGYDSNYRVLALPTTAAAGRPVAVAIRAFASNTTQLQYGWFQIGGKATVLKTAVTVSPDSRLFQSGTAGRFYVTASATKQILGARTVNSATVTSTTSSVLVVLNRPNTEGA